ncbi:MAG: CTP synthase, partial [bacterium]|nr:CTP synthase [bacterium]
EKERNLGYKGKCVEAIPHITGEILRRIEKAAELNGSNISLIEIGGTVGDYQNILFIEAARVLKLKHPNDVLFILVSYLPVPSKIGEMKTRPTQNAVRMLNSYGVQPDIIIARSEIALDKKRKEKIAISCNVQENRVISAPDIESIYDVPINFERDRIGETILKALHLRPKANCEGMDKWRAFVGTTTSSKDEISIAIVGKYFDTGDFVLSDAYISVIEAIKFSAFKQGFVPNISWLNAKDFEKSKRAVKMLSTYDGIIVPGGFGETGIEGKLSAIRYVREQKIPYFGLCYGMQLAVVEYARNVLGWEGAHTTEINPATEFPVIHIMPDQKKKLEEGNYGGSMRLGAYPAKLKKGSVAEESYGKSEIEERHRHRFEVNNGYIEELERAGLVFSGTSPDGKLMEIAELPKSTHPFFLGTQFHPEFQARPLSPHPLFSEFIRASIEFRKTKLSSQRAYKQKNLIEVLN